MPKLRPDPRGAGRIAAILAFSSLAMVATSLVLLVPNVALPTFLPLGFFGIGTLVFGVTLPAVGWLIVSRSPANRIGWLFLLSGLLQAIDTFAQQYATYGLMGHPGSMPFADLAAWVYNWAYVPGLLLFLPALLLFPDGTLPSPRWRPVVWLVAAAAVLTLPAQLAASWEYRGAGLISVVGPDIYSGRNSLAGQLVGVGGLLLMFGMGAVVAAVVVRFRRSVGIERLQLKWFAFAAVLTIVMLMGFSLVAFAAGSTAIPAPFDSIAGIAEGALLPIAVGIAVLRYRLYDIDVVIRRTLVYVPLTALLAGLYAASIGISQRAFIAVIGQQSDGAIIVSTLLLAATFTPIKNAIQGRVDRAFRDAKDAARRLGSFTQAVHDQTSTPDPARSMRAFLGTAIAAARSGGGEAWFETPAGEESVGATDARGTGPRALVVVEAGGQRFGRLELDARAGGRLLAAGDLDAVRAAAGDLARVLAGIRPAMPAAMIAGSTPPLVVEAGD